MFTKSIIKRVWQSMFEQTKFHICLHINFTNHHHILQTKVSISYVWPLVPRRSWLRSYSGSVHETFLKTFSYMNFCFHMSANMFLIFLAFIFSKIWNCTSDTNISVDWKRWIRWTQNTQNTHTYISFITLY